MIASTPGTPWRGLAARRRAAAGGAAGAGRAPADALRSAVRAIIADCTPGTARTACSARLRTGSQAFTAPASTLIEKNTLPSLTTTSESAPVLGSGVPSGDGTLRVLPEPRPSTPSMSPGAPKPRALGTT